MSTERKEVQGKLKLNSTVTPYHRKDDFEETPKNSWEVLDATIYDVRYHVFLLLIFVFYLFGVIAWLF